VRIHNFPRLPASEDNTPANRVAIVKVAANGDTLAVTIAANAKRMPAGSFAGALRISGSSVKTLSVPIRLTRSANSFLVWPLAIGILGLVVGVVVSAANRWKALAGTTTTTGKAVSTNPLSGVWHIIWSSNGAVAVVLAFAAVVGIMFTKFWEPDVWSAGSDGYSLLLYVVGAATTAAAVGFAFGAGAQD
jgi:hypothetical protein